MIDIRTLQQALLLSWVPKLFQTGTNGTWKAFPLFLLSQMGTNLALFKFNCSYSDFVSLPENINKSIFWTKVLQAWFILKQKHPDVIQPTIKLSDPIWNNPNIRYRHKYLHIKDWTTHGITQIHHVLDENEQMLTFEEIELKVGASPRRLLEYNAVKTAILNAQKNHPFLATPTEHEQEPPVLLLDKPISTYTSKQLRHLLTDTIQPCAVNFWQRKLQTTLDSKYWSLPFTACKETRLRVLQWKILHNIYPTNILLHKMGIAPSEKCNACNADKKDYIEHFFFTCSKISGLWEHVKRIILMRTGQTLNITTDIALLGFIGESKHRGTINYLLTLAKMCISKYRYGEGFPIVLIFERELMIRDQLTPTVNNY